MANGSFPILCTLQSSKISWHDTTHFMAAWRMALRCCRKRSQARDDRRSFTSSCTALRAALGPACADLSVASSAFNATERARVKGECVKTSKVHSPHSLPLCGEMTLRALSVSEKGTLTHEISAHATNHAGLTSSTPRRCLVRASSLAAATRTCGESELEAQKLCARNTRFTADSNSLCAMKTCKHGK